MVDIPRVYFLELEFRTPERSCLCHTPPPSSQQLVVLVASRRQRKAAASAACDAKPVMYCDVKPLVRLALSGLSTMAHVPVVTFREHATSIHILMDAMMVAPLGQFANPL